MSELSTGFKLMRRALNTGSVRALIRYCIKKCERCGRRPIDTYLDELLGMKIEKCLECRIALSILRFVTGVTVKPEKWKGPGNSSIKDVISKSYWRKGVVSLLKGILYFGPRKPFVTGAPLLVVWNFTNRCNLACQHCYQDAKPSGLSNELTTEEALKIVNEFAEAEVTSISFSGGEPLLRRDIYDVAKRAKDLGMYVSIATNGTMLTKETAQKLSEAVHYVEISLDGVTPYIHDGFRGVSGAWEKAIQGIRNSVEAGLYTTIATTATKINLAEIPEIVRFTEEVGAKGFLCFNFIPTGRAFDAKNIDLSPTERENLLKFLYEKLVDFTINGGPNIFVTAPQFSRVGIQHSKTLKEKFASQCRNSALIPTTHYGNLPDVTTEVAGYIGGCGAGRVYCGLNPDGVLIPCVFMPIPLGNLRRERFEDLWVNSPILNDLRNRDKLVGRCGRCGYRYICGGCRARAYGYAGNYLYPDPGCIRSLEEA
ncbi:MAG: radical SAM protein [Candidatus Bathyarchaeia archaeon]